MAMLPWQRAGDVTSEAPILRCQPQARCVTMMRSAGIRILRLIFVPVVLEMSDEERTRSGYDRTCAILTYLSSLLIFHFDFDLYLFVLSQDHRKKMVSSSQTEKSLEDTLNPQRPIKLINYSNR
jgi:hypothetical protein